MRRSRLMTQLAGSSPYMLRLRDPRKSPAPMGCATRPASAAPIRRSRSTTQLTVSPSYMPMVTSSYGFTGFHVPRLMRVGVTQITHGPCDLGHRLGPNGPPE